MKIGIIGAGNIGSGMARLGVQHGHKVMVSNSRGPETLAGLVQGIGCKAGTTDEAARFGDIVVVTIPLKQYRSIPAEPLAGKVRPERSPRPRLGTAWTIGPIAANSSWRGRSRPKASRFLMKCSKATAPT